MKNRIELLRHAVKLWSVPHVPKEINRANARKWVVSVERLGDKWLLAKKVERLGGQHGNC